MQVNIKYVKILLRGDNDMLNPKLIEEYGEECKEFFNEFINSVDPKVIDLCYAITGLKLNSGRLCGPYFIGVKTDDDSVVWSAQRRSINISLDLKDDDDERDIGIMCISCTEDKAREDGIKIWV